MDFVDEHSRNLYRKLATEVLAQDERIEALEQLLSEYIALADEATSDYGVYPPGWPEKRAQLQERARRLLQKQQG